MSVSSFVFFTIFISAVVTWIPRVLPFLVTKYVKLPKVVEKFLKFLPITILSALLLQCLLQEKIGSFPTFKFLECLAFIPAILVAIRTKDLMKTVVVGVLTMAILRHFL